MENSTALRQGPLTPNLKQLVDLDLQKLWNHFFGDGAMPRWRALTPVEVLQLRNYLVVPKLAELLQQERKINKHTGMLAFFVCPFGLALVMNSASGLFLGGILAGLLTYGSFLYRARTSPLRKAYGHWITAFSGVNKEDPIDRFIPSELLTTLGNTIQGRPVLQADVIAAMGGACWRI